MYKKGNIFVDEGYFYESYGKKERMKQKKWPWA